MAKRIIPCLDVKEGQVVKGTNFVDLKFAGDACKLAEKYYLEGADELVFLDITATLEKRKTLFKLVDDVAKKVRIPFTVGGGVKSLNDFEEILRAGADKVAINSAVVLNPKLVNDAAGKFGSQAVVIAVDVKTVNGEKEVFINAGTEPTGKKALSWLLELEERGAGEILITSMDHDGTRNGFDNLFLAEVSAKLGVPVIASGGAGNKEHFRETFAKTNVDACLAAGIFHYGELTIKELKNYLAENNIEVRL